MVNYLMLKSLGRLRVFAGLACLAIVTGLLMSLPASAEPIRNQLTITQPYDLSFTDTTWLKDTCPSNQFHAVAYSYAQSYGKISMILEGHAESDLPCIAETENIYGSATLGSSRFECLRPGEYTVSASGVLNGMAGIYVHPQFGGWRDRVTLKIGLGVRDPSGSYIGGTEEVLFDHEWSYTNPPPGIGDSTAVYFSDSLIEMMVADVNFATPGMYSCYVTISASVRVSGNYAYGVWGIVDIYPSYHGLGPFPYGGGGFELQSITVTDQNPDYTAPEAIQINTEMLDPCTYRFSIKAIDDENGYGVGSMAIRTVPGPYPNYTYFYDTDSIQITVPTPTHIYVKAIDYANNAKEWNWPVDPPAIFAPTISCAADGYGIDIDWDPTINATMYHVYRDGLFMETTTETSWRDEDPGVSPRYYKVMAASPCNQSEFSNTVECQAIPPYVKLAGGALNGTGVVDGILEIAVDPGEPIQGTVVVETHNNAPPSNLAPLALVWGWGDHAASYATAQGNVMDGTRQFSVPISLVAPIPPGDYYISLAYALEMSAANVASLCNWQVPGSPHWNDLKDMADWGSTEYEQSVLEHQITTPYEGTGGWSDRKVAAAMIKVTVNEKPPCVKLHSGALNGHPVTGGVLEFSVQAGTPITGTLNIATFNPFDPGNIAPLVAVRGWGDHASGFQTVNPWVSYGFSQYSATLNLTAPWEGGVYYISFAYALEMAGHHVASLCNWQVPGAPHWDDEKDMADWDAAQYGHAKSGDLVTTPYEGPSGWHDAQIPADMVKVTVIPRGSIAGTVTETTGDNLHGVTVDLYDAAGTTLLATTVTDDGGVYRFDDVIAVDYHVAIVTPLGYLADAETKGVTVMPGEESLVDFVLARRDIVSAQQGLGYWKHHANLALTDPSAQEVPFDSLCHYLELIHIHFNGNLEYPVTAYVYDDQESCVDNLQVLTESLNLHLNAEPEISDPDDAGEMGAILKPNLAGPGITMQDRAIQHFIPMLLNVASCKMATFDVISDDGLTVSQAITYCDQLITDPAMVIQHTINGEAIMPGVDYDIRVNHELAKDIAERVNLGLPIPVGVIPGSTPNIAYRPDETEKPVPNEYFLSQNHPNPFNPYTLIRFELPRAAHVSLEVFNVAGQRIASLCSQYIEAGRYTFEWDGRDNDGRSVASGVYFYRVRTPDFTESRKMVLLK